MSDRRNSVLTPLRVVPAIAIILSFAFAASWTSLPTRAGGDADAQSAAAPEPLHSFGVRTGIVDPMRLPPPTTIPGVARHFMPSRVANPAAYRRSKAAMSSGEALPEVPSLATLAMTTTPTVLTSFAGLASRDSGCGVDCEPPDTQVAAGPNNIVEVTNVVVRIFDKSGTVLSTFDLNSLFGVDPSIVSANPRIEYDTISGRWLVSLLTLDTGNVSNAQNGFFNLAVSSSTDPTEPFYTYKFETHGAYPSQPSLGFNDDKVVTGGNSFSCLPTNCGDTNLPYLGMEFVVWNKADLIADVPPATDFFPADQDPTDFTVEPAKSRSSTSTLFMLSDPDDTGAAQDHLTVWSVAGIPGVGGGSTSTKTALPITTFADPPNARQEGAPATIHTEDARMLEAVFRDGHLWGSANAACKPPGDSTKRSCMHYLEVLTGDARLILNQDFEFGTKNAYDYYPSVDLDSSDDLITAFTQSSSGELPSAYVDARLVGDAPDTLGTPMLLQSGGMPYDGIRWGDYSGAGVDPADQTQVWVAAEYATKATLVVNWGTTIADARVVSGVVPTATATATPTATSTPAPVGTLRVSTSDLSFGGVKVGKPKSKTFKIKNSGKFPLQVTVGTVDSPFTVDIGGGMLTLASGKSEKVVVQFQPTAMGATPTQTVSITSNDPDHLSAQVTLTGSGK
jgi:Abnormal spindle-like microcephaly-assoc'd, ASPM-SPD-2-Hydin